VAWSLVEVTAPATEPVTTAEVKSAIRVDISTDDTRLDNLTTAIREEYETIKRRTLVTTTFDLFLDCFPSSDYVPIILPRPPLASITTIKYYDTDGNQQTWSSALYEVDTNIHPGRVKPIDGESWPDTDDNKYGLVEIRFVAGYGAAAAVPQRFKRELFAQIQHWYDIIGPTLDRDMKEVPLHLSEALYRGRGQWLFS
jgi:uncharacterized phiE125 gp8 family phage protein